MRVGDERRYLNEYQGQLEVHTHYDNNFFNITVDFSRYIQEGLIILHVWTRRRDPGTGKPHVQFFPHGTVRISKETGEVYDWFEY